MKPGLFALFIDRALWTDRNELTYKNSKIPPTDTGTYPSPEIALRIGMGS